MGMHTGFSAGGISGSALESIGIHKMNETSMDRGVTPGGTNVGRSGNFASQALASAKQSTGASIV
jgi:hypothetical protein